MPRKNPPNYLPGPSDYDHEPLLEALRIAREELVKYRSAVGNKTPARSQSDTAIDHIDAAAKLMGYPGADKVVHPVGLPTTKEVK